MKTEFQRTAGSAGVIGLTAFGGALVGFVLQLLVAFYFGASSQTDAYFMALSTSEMLSKLLLGGSIAAVFLPMFVEHLTHGNKQEAWSLALNILHLTAALFALVIAALAIFAHPFVTFIAPGFDQATSDLTVQLLRVLLPSFLFLYLVELATAMLHSLRQFALPASLRILSPLTSIIVIITSVRIIGIYALALGTVIGSLLQFAVLLWGLRRQGLSYRFVFQPLDPAIKRLVYLVYPFVFSVLVTQAAGIVYRILVSDLTQGSLAALKFSEKITQLLTIVFLNSVTFVIYPLLSQKAARHDISGMRDTIGSAIRLITFVTVPVIIGIAILREPLVALLFQRGSFSADDAALTSIALLYLVIGLTTNGISSVLGHATLALQRTRVSVAVSIASHAIAIYLFVLLVPKMAHAGLALGSSLVPVTIALLYFLYLTRAIPRLSRIFVHPTFAKIAILATLLVITLTATLPSIRQIAAPRTIALILQLVIPSLAGTVVFFGGAYLWRIPEMRELSAIAQSFLKRRRPHPR